MIGYIPLTLACKTFGKSRRVMESMMKTGKVRYKKTKSIVTKRPTIWICQSDVTDADQQIPLSYDKISSIQKEQPVSSGVIRYLIANGRLRWTKRGAIRFVCVEDVKQYAARPGKKVNNRKMSD